MIYLSMYLAMGVVVRIVLLILAQMKIITICPFLAHNFNFDIFPERKKKLFDWLMQNVVDPWVFGVILWPIVVFIETTNPILIKAKPTSKRESVSEEEVFNITRYDLIKKMTVQEIEDHERIVDPLKAVPDVPFGHLNNAWLKFKENLEPDDLIFTFSAEWSMWIYKKEKRGGYVILRGENIGPYLLTSRMTIENGIIEI